MSTEMDVSAHAAAQAPSKLGLKPGQTIDVETAIRAIVTKSANDVAVVVAEALGGSEENFARMMTAKARALGMMHTVYRDASGLPNDEQITTARDMTILARAIQDRFPQYYHYFATRTFDLPRRGISQPQSPARPRRRRRRHEDRLHSRLRLQHRRLDAPRPAPCLGRGVRRTHRFGARRARRQPA